MKKSSFAVFLLLTVLIVSQGIASADCAVDPKTGKKCVCKTNFTPKNVHAPSAAETVGK